jgi:DNA adenine methylase
MEPGEEMKTQKPASVARSGTSERRKGSRSEARARKPLPASVARRAKASGHPSETGTRPDAGGAERKDNYPGRKRVIAKRIVSLMPAHDRYVEAFAGTADVLRLKRPAKQSIAIDLSTSQLTALPKGALPIGTTVICGDAVRWLEEHASELGLETLVYLDPPYLLSTRTHRFYEHELETDQEHSALLTILQELRCHVMISGYWSPLYAAMLEPWATEQIGTMTRGGPRTEWLWMNFRADHGLQLHDTRFLGRGFRERERINRKKRRWAKRLAAMDPAERQAIREALDGSET